MPTRAPALSDLQTSEPQVNRPCSVQSVGHEKCAASHVGDFTPAISSTPNEYTDLLHRMSLTVPFSWCPSSLPAGRIYPHRFCAVRGEVHVWLGVDVQGLDTTHSNITTSQKGQLRDRSVA